MVTVGAPRRAMAEPRRVSKAALFTLLWACPEPTAAAAADLVAGIRSV